MLAENERYIEAFDRSALTAAPLSGLAIVACMDARLDVEEALGLRTGDAHIIRNAGGLATDDVDPLAHRQPAACSGPTRSSSSATRAAACRARTRTRCGSTSPSPDGTAPRIDFGSFADLEANRPEPRSPAADASVAPSASRSTA